MSSINPKGQPTAPKQSIPSDLVHHKLPEKPLVVIEPSKSWARLNLHDLWNYRDLLYILAPVDGTK